MLRAFEIFRVVLNLAVIGIAAWVVVGWVSDDDGPPGDVVFFLFIGYVLWTCFLAPRVRRRIESTV